MAVLMENNADPNLQDKEVKISSAITVHLSVTVKHGRSCFCVCTGADGSPLVMQQRLPGCRQTATGL